METDKQILYLEFIQFLSEFGSNVGTLRKLMNEYREKSEQSQYAFYGQYNAGTSSQTQKRAFDTAFGDSDPHQQVFMLSIYVSIALFLYI